MNLVDIIGILAGICTTVAVLPQIIKAWKTKEVKDVSKGMFAVLITGLALWVVYGLFKKDWPIIVTNAVSLGLNGFMMFLMIRYNKSKNS